jgi:hypothetical protein
LRSRLLVALLIVLALTLFGSAAYAAKNRGFEGAWKSVDYAGGQSDKSNMWLWIAEYSGVYDFLYFDDLCSGCTGETGKGPPCLFISSARLSEPNRLNQDGGVITCLWEAGPEVLSTTYTTYFELSTNATNATKLTIVDGDGNVWVPSKNKNPDKIIHSE